MWQYHDIAASTKVRGQGIGFAGIDIKLELLVCEKVPAETRRGNTHVAMRWHLVSRHRIPWQWGDDAVSYRRLIKGHPSDHRELAERALPLAAASSTPQPSR
jgi:hypothetical protein